MANKVCSRTASVTFWDGYAPWYKLWMEHNRYHNRIIEALTTMVEPGWKVLDIGAGNGVLSLPLCAMGCEVTAIEPSTGMRNLLFEEAMQRGIDWIRIDDRRWEDIPSFHFADYDLVMACNSLHLTGQGFEQFSGKGIEDRGKECLCRVRAVARNQNTLVIRQLLHALYQSPTKQRVPLLITRWQRYWTITPTKKVVFLLLTKNSK